MKKLFEYFLQGSPMHIVLHAQYRRSRGRRPVAISATTRNPRQALRTAEKALHDNWVVLTHLAKPCTTKVIRMAMERVGLRLLNQRELELVVRTGVPCLVSDEKRYGMEYPDESWNSNSHFCFVR